MDIKNKIKMSTYFAEKVYSLLIKLVNANSSYYNKELFIFHYCVFENSSNSFNLDCIDFEERIFHYSNNKIWITGKNEDRVNKALSKLLINENRYPNKQR
jgi:hypothetical protein